jgi:hypothetical protein
VKVSSLRALPGWLSFIPDVASDSGGQCEPPLPSTSVAYMPLEHFLAVTSHFIPAFSQSAWFFGVFDAAIAGALEGHDERQCENRS